MAKKKAGTSASPRGSSGGGESNTGLIVSLVFFVLLAIGLGVTTYLGYGGKAEAEAKAKQAEDKATAADKKANEQEAAKAALLIAIGAARESDRTTFSGRKAAATGAINEAIGLLKNIPAWDINNPANQPTKTYTTLLQEAQQAQTNAERTTRQREAELADARKQYDAERADLNAKFKAMEKKFNDASAEVAKTREQVHGGSDINSKKIQELTAQLSQVTLDAANKDVEATRKIKTLEAQIESFKRSREALFGNLGPSLDKIGAVAEAHPDTRELAEVHDLLRKHFGDAINLSNDSHKGNVIRVDRNKDLVYVNLGSADAIRPQVSFSIMPPGSTGKTAAGRARKGAVEIVTVLEPHLSTAKIVEETSPYRDPIMAGDLLFNPAWDPSQRQHVAIAGIVDLNGDGVDDLPDLIRTLERQGVVVDAYLDLKSRQIKGPGMTERTAFLIVGDEPQLSQTILAQEGNALAEAARGVIGQMSDMKTKAKDMGVARVPYRKFLTLVGFKLPKGTSDISASSYLRGTSSSKGAETVDDKPR